jgi:ubiquinone/menaquinone biosynthesis C-methylase UbiE
MPLTQPSTLELNTLRALADFSHKKVVEVGAGDGRLTWPLAAEAARWVSLDPDDCEIGEAVKATRLPPFPDALLVVGDGRSLSLPADYFDIAFFSWSLC